MNEEEKERKKKEKAERKAKRKEAREAKKKARKERERKRVSTIVYIAMITTKSSLSPKLRSSSFFFGTYLILTVSVTKNKYMARTCGTVATLNFI